MVSSVGKISGKFSEGGTNWTFSAASFNAASRSVIETGATGGSRPVATEIEAWQNLWGSAYKALGKTLFTIRRWPIASQFQ